MFFLRAPVLIVTDSSFNQLYGPRRLALEGAGISLRLFRRVMPVLVSETADPGNAALAAEAASSTPRAVLFPFRYAEGAGIYSGNHPDIPVFVMGGRNPAPRGEAAFSFVRTDTAGDIYRAGLCAAFIAGDRKAAFFGGGDLPAGYREAFQEGFDAQGGSEPVYLDAAADFPLNSDIGCVVLAGSAASLSVQNKEQQNLNPQIPVILFSWVDPALTPQTVKIIFDDSPWALAEKVLAASSPGEIIVSSEPLIIKNRIKEKGDFRKIQDLIKGNFQKK